MPRKSHVFAIVTLLSLTALSACEDDPTDGQDLFGKDAGTDAAGMGSEPDSSTGVDAAAADSGGSVEDAGADDAGSDDAG